MTAEAWICPDCFNASPDDKHHENCSGCECPCNPAIAHLTEERDHWRARAEAAEFDNKRLKATLVKIRDAAMSFKECRDAAINALLAPSPATGAPTLPVTLQTSFQAVTCTRCNGSGSIGDPGSVMTTCFSCGGRGYLHVPAFQPDTHAGRAELAAAKQECERLARELHEEQRIALDAAYEANKFRAANGRLTEALGEVDELLKPVQRGLAESQSQWGRRAIDDARMKIRAALSATSQPSGGAGVEKDGDKQ